MPPVAAALGMAVAYYGYPFFPAPPVRYLFFALCGLLVALTGFFRVLRSLPDGKKSARVAAASLLVTAAAVGFALGAAARINAPGPAQPGIPVERVVAVSGILREDPRTLQGGPGYGSLDLFECAGPGGLRASARGNVTVFFPEESIPRLKEFGRGCRIYAEGTLLLDGRGALFRASSVHITSPAPAVEQFRTGLRLKVLEKFQGRQGRALAWGSLASALILGVRDDLNTGFAEGFRNSGCSHVLALSGMHLAVVSAVLAFLLKRPLGVRGASLAGAAFTVFYVFVAGSQPSLVRAAIMYLIGAAAVWGLLKTRPLGLLSIAFIVQIIFQGGSGVSYSFILSYLSLAGILTLGATIRVLFRGRLPGAVSGGLSASLGAFIATAPVVAFFFGSLRPIGIAAGLIIAPLCSVFMVLSLAALAAAFLPVPLWALFDSVLTLLYRLLDFLVSLAGKVPGAAVSDPVPVLAVCAALWLLVYAVEKKDSARRDSVASFG